MSTLSSSAPKQPDERRAKSTNYEIHLADAFEWLESAPPHSVHGVLTDPPYGVVEFTSKELDKLRSGRGGIWRLPPNIGGSQRNPLPRFTVLTDSQLKSLSNFFEEWGRLLYPVLVPGAHVLVASNPFISPWVQTAMYRAGYEIRGQIIRLYRTLRGGDRPKNREKDFPHLQTSLRAAHEPWLLFRKPLEKGLTVGENLEKWHAGALKRFSETKPFPDVIESSRTPKKERELGHHPTQKPLSLLQLFADLLLPYPHSTLLDPFMGSGSTIAATASLGHYAIGIEIDKEFYTKAAGAIPRLLELALGQPPPLLR